LVQFLWPNRFAEIAIHSARHAFLSIPFHGVRRQSDHGLVESAAFLFFSNYGCRLEPIHLGHLDIHQHKVKTSLFQRLQRLQTGSCHDHPVSSLLQ
jgi:hypothetical protein